MLEFVTVTLAVWWVPRIRQRLTNELVRIM